MSSGKTSRSSRNGHKTRGSCKSIGRSTLRSRSGLAELNKAMKSGEKAARRDAHSVEVVGVFELGRNQSKVMLAELPNKWR